MIPFSPSLAALIGRMGIGLILKSSHNLMDKSCKKEEKMKEVLRHESRFVDFHDLRTRRQGNQIFSEFHLSVKGVLSVEDMHSFTDHLEDELREELPNINLTIHV